MKMKETKKVLGRYRKGRETTLERIEKIDERLEEIRERFEQILEDGDGVTAEAESLMQERREISGERSEMLTIGAVFDEKIAGARADLARLAVGETFASAQKTAGGLVGERPRHIERAEEYERKAQESREKAESGSARAYRLRWAVQAVAKLLGMEATEIRVVEGVRPPRAPIRELLGQGKLRRAGKGALQILDAEDLLSPEAKEAIENAIADLDDDEEARLAREENQTRVDEQAAEREKARDEVDEWLREMLSNGPVPRDRVHRAARKNGIALAPRGTHGADLHTSRRRLDVEPVERIEDPSRPRPSWWALPGTWDDETFRRIADASSSMAMR